jgi:hypothetical protein
MYGRLFQSKVEDEGAARPVSSLVAESRSLVWQLCVHNNERREQQPQRALRKWRELNVLGYIVNLLWRAECINGH